MNKKEIKLLKELIDENKLNRSISDDYAHEIDVFRTDTAELQKTVRDLTNGILENTHAGGKFEPQDPTFHFPKWVLELVPFPILKAYLEEHCPEED